MKTIWFNNDALKELLSENGIELICNEDMQIQVSDEDAERIPAIIEEFAPDATGDYGIERYIVPMNRLEEVADFFINLYEDELDEMSTDCIYEWYNLNKWDWGLGYCDEDVYDQVEKAILDGIETRRNNSNS